MNVKQLIYLTPDSPHTLTSIDPTNYMYVLGGIVDRTVCSGLSYQRATSLGIRTARLPLHLASHHCSKPSLGIDAATGILIDVAQHGDWTKAFAKYVPKRTLRS